MKLARRIKTLLTRPELALEYASFTWSKLRNHGQGTRTLYNGLKIRGFSGFSEFHSCAEFVSPEEKAFLETYDLTAGDIVDVGANLGIVSLILARRYPRRVVHAFEPNPSTFRSMRGNCELNSCPNISPIECAVADHN